MELFPLWEREKREKLINVEINCLFVSIFIKL